MSNAKSEELKAKILARLAAPQLCPVATVTENGKPWVRYMTFMTDQNLTMWAATFANSRKVAQIAKNPEVSLAAGAKDMMSTEPFLQIQARAAILTDAATKKAVWNEFLKDVFSGPDDPNFAVCKVTPYKIEYVKMDRSPTEVWEA